MNGSKGVPGARRLTAAAVFLSLLIGGILLQRREADPPPAPAPPPAPVRQATPEPAPAKLTPPPPVGRGELIEIVDAAASAHAAGTAPPANVLVGRRFALQLPFGCFGPTVDPNATLSWRYDAAQQVLRLRAQPVVWTGTPLALAVAQGVQYEAVEGFWIDRPWLRTETCPRPVRPGAVFAGEAAVPQTIGLAEFFEAGGRRAERRDGQPYDAAIKVAPEELSAEQGFVLVLEGRIAALADGRPIGCLSQSSERQPTCLVAVSIDRVAFENAATKESYAYWPD